MFPESFFYLGPLPDLPEGHFRKLKKGTAKTGKQVRAQVRQLVELVERAEPQLRLPSVAIRPVDDLVRLEAVEEVADATRASLGLGERDPIPNLTRATERAGVVVVRLPGAMEDHDGFSVWPNYGFDGRPLIAISSGHPGDRDRFNVAHELGHLVLHTGRRHLEPKEAEREAHRFAGALLLPRQAAREVIRRPVTLGSLKLVKEKYGVSIGALAKRALDLNFVSKEQFVSLRKQMSKRGWNRIEPVEVEPEGQLLIAKMLSILAGDGSTSQRAERVAMPLFTFRSLAGE
jgi:Zn-dependent peptidase ImmA (M78 family)